MLAGGTRQTEMICASTRSLAGGPLASTNHLWPSVKAVCVIPFGPNALGFQTSHSFPTRELRSNINNLNHDILFYFAAQVDESYNNMFSSQVWKLYILSAQILSRDY